MDEWQGALSRFLALYGREERFAPGAIICRQGLPSDGLYYLKEGRLRVYREEPDAVFPLSEIGAGEIVGELGAATGWVRTATVEAVEDSVVIHVPEAEFRHALLEEPELAVEIARLATRRLTDADAARVTLGRSCQQALVRVQKLDTEKAQLEELLLLREEMANMLVHDLRNPLGVIRGGLELLQDMIEAEEGKALVEMMGRAAGRMRRLVDMLLDIARMEEGGLTLQRELLDVQALAEEAVMEEQPYARLRGIELTNRVLAGLPSVSGDRDMLQRVLINLLDNALNFTPEGGQVWVEGRPWARGVEMAVVDTGPGIPLQERERIFEKFTQVRGRHGARRGSGLGLAFCRLAVEAHGGEIWVEDGPGGVGSRFVMALGGG